MIIDLSSALKHPGQSFAFSAEGTIDNIELYGDLIKITNPIKVDGTIMYTGRNFTVKGFFEIEYTTACALCFAEDKENMAVDFSEEFSQESDIDLPDIYAFAGNSLDIKEMIINNICLNMPLRHLCSPDCKGLCPVCGVNLNETTCECETTIEQSDFSNEVVKNKKDNPFAVLENLFSDDNEEA